MLLRLASLPAWERELKLTFRRHRGDLEQSLPAWERELKRLELADLGVLCLVAPRVGA